MTLHAKSVLTLAIILSLCCLHDKAEASQEELYIGIWSESSKVTDDNFAARYALNADGTFIFAAASDVIPKNRLEFADGKWSIANGELRLEFKTMYILPVAPGKLKAGKGLTLLSNGLHRKICNPPEVETFSINNTGTDNDTGKKTIEIDGVTFYNLNEQSNLFRDYQALPKK